MVTDVGHCMVAIHMQLDASSMECLRAAFHAPRDVFDFAVEFNEALLTAKWPKELLTVDEFAPTCIVPM